MISYFRKNFVFRSNYSFTLIETLVVVAILAALTTTAFVSLANYKNRHALDLDAEEIASALSNAQNKAIQQEGGSAWGVRFINGTTDYYQIFKGSSYAASGVISSSQLSGTSVFTNPASGTNLDVVFATRTGNPTTGGGAVVVIKQSGSSNVYSIFASNGGKVSKNLRTGLVGYWPMDEGSGTTAYDVSGNGSTGTLINSPTWQGISNCRVGGCLGFDGISQYVQVNNSSYLNPSSLTISVWAKSNTATWNDYGFLVSKRAVYIIHPTQGATSVSFYIFTTTWVSVGCTPSTAITNWNLYTLTWDGTTLSCYINGALGSSVNPGGSINTTDTGYLTIGKDDEISRYFNGSEDDVRIYSRALSTTEVQNLYNSY